MPRASPCGPVAAVSSERWPAGPEFERGAGELNDQGLDPSANVVANSPNAFDGLTLRVVQRPVNAAHPGRMDTRRHIPS